MTVSLCSVKGKENARYFIMYLRKMRDGLSCAAGTIPGGLLVIVFDCDVLSRAYADQRRFRRGKWRRRPGGAIEYAMYGWQRGGAQVEFHRFDR